MKIDVCEVCYKRNKKLVKSKYSTGFKGLLKISVCEKCSKEIPDKKLDFIKFCYGLDGMKLSDEKAQKIILGDI